MVEVDNSSGVFFFQRFPILSALINRDNSQFFINGQFKSSPDLIPRDMIIEGLPFRLQKDLILTAWNIDSFRYNYEELHEINPNISEEQAFQVYSQLRQYYDQHIGRDSIIDGLLSKKITRTMVNMYLPSS